MRTAMLATATMVLVGSLAFAQTAPTPGPTNPTPVPVTKADADVVMRPTLDNCRADWNPSLRWTREQFAIHCGQMQAAK
jgi:hypothetical protein